MYELTLEQAFGPDIMEELLVVEHIDAELLKGVKSM